MLRPVNEAGKPTTFRVRHFAALRERPSSTRLLRRLAARADWHAAGSSPARTETVGPQNKEPLPPQRIPRLSPSHSFHSNRPTPENRKSEMKGQVVGAAGPFP